MNWNGKNLATIGDLSDAVLAIARSDDQTEADRFMAQYRAESEHADSNIGYMSGYYDRDTMAKVQRMFRVAHPIFGTQTDVSPEQALEAGKRAALGEFNG